MTDTETGSASFAAGDVFASDPEVGPDLARVDWAGTPLGDPSGWPQSLQTAVRILLRSRFSMWMAWGPELTFFCNTAYRDQSLGGKYPWALGRPAREVWAEIWEDIGPRIDHVFDTGDATWDEGLQLIVERSGFPEESYHTFSYSALSDDDGRIVGMLCVVSEDTTRVISERRMTTLRELGSDPDLLPSEEQTLQTAAVKLSRNPFDLPFALLYLFDGDGPARLVARAGLPEGHPAAPDELDVADDAVWPCTHAIDGQSRVVDLDGALFADLPAAPWPQPPAQALLAPLAQPGVAPYGVLVAGLNRYRPLDDAYRGFIDLVASHIAGEIGSARSYLTQQRRAAELAELDRAKTVFFSNVSHEFRTPLTLMLGPVAELLDGSADSIGADARRELEVVQRNGLRLTKLVNTLLDFARIEADRMQARYVPTDAATLTAELASGFRSAVERAGLTFVVDCPPLDEPLYLDRDMWEKVVLNILSNAVKFTEQGSITVRTGRDDTHAVFTIADTGIGVSSAELPRLFERFHRIPATWARSHEGSGIGLALVRELVTLHGGTITAESTETVGTTFTVRIPFGTAHLPPQSLGATAEGGDTTSPTQAANPYLEEALHWLPDADGSEGEPARAAAPNTAARVLVADDNADMRHYITRLLTGAGYVVEEAADGRHALDIIRHQPPELVVSDVMMPHLDGLELVAALRSDPRTAALPVLLLSARAGTEASIDGLRAGADDYLVKPFAASELLARVQANISLARMRGHHERWHDALIDSLQEAFFVCDENGAVIEINAAFTEILGYGPDGLPYAAVHPWWPDATTDPEAYQLVQTAFEDLLHSDRGVYTVPVTHRDGHRLWVTFTFTHAEDPVTGRRLTIGTLRDTTAEHYRRRRDAALADLSHALVTAETVDQAVESTAAVVREIWQARRVVTALFAADGAGEPRVIVAGAPAAWTDLPAAKRRFIESLCDAEPLTPLTGGPGTAAIAVQHPDGVLVLWIELAENRPFTSPDHTLLAMLAGHFGQGLHRVHRLDQQHRTAVALQHAILGPAVLPNGFTARYRPATTPLQVGGDWYDVIDLTDGRTGLIVGDCVGHGLDAATVMGQLRSACRALLLENPSPAAALTGLDRFAVQLDGARCTTVFCAVLDTDSGQLIYSNAGHPPPIVLDAGSSVRVLAGGRGIPVGVRPGRDRTDAHTTLSGRATLLIYTDGLVERRGESLDEGITRAGDLLGLASTVEQSDGLADRLIAQMTPPDGYSDDVAMLLYRHPGPLHVSVPAEVGQLATTRDALRIWLQRNDIGVEQVQDLLVAVGEAIANSIEHGHRGGRAGTVTLSGTANGASVHIRIVDTGEWKPADEVPHPTRGRGLKLMRALTEDVAIHSDSLGTTVDMHARIS
ncbi:SpoIIE family protein phosphatase [Mycolicibacterium bacteremicum]|uniref:SpoIIE family protein phosphatase n=1 Tax=Mycolicibacterium bacteremicum TaxID=564198 RepID=UPI0026F06887|nr:SpoIIE family protein phosphatase [Mycolicibacterium bacteremicum]